MILEGSRYAGVLVLRAKDAEGVARPTIYAMAATGQNLGAYRQHVVQEGDRFDTLAHALWGDPELWWRIADVNPEVVYPDGLVPGTVIRIPA